jgi:hypothetical protein
MSIPSKLLSALVLSVPVAGHGLEAVAPDSGTADRATLVWLSTAIGDARYDGQPAGGVNAARVRYDSRSTRTTVGIDHSFNQHFSMFASFGASDSDVEPVGQLDDEARSKDWQLGVRYAAKALTFNVTAFHRASKADQARVVVLPLRETTQRVVLDARIQSEETGFELGVSRSFDLSETWWWSPGIGLSYVHLTTDDFIEMAGARNVFEVATEPRSEWYASVQLTSGALFFTGDWVLMPSGRIGVEKRLNDDSAESVATFVPTRYGYVSEGYDEGSTRFSIGAGLSVRHLGVAEGAAGARLDVDHHRQHGYSQSLLTLVLEYDF